MSLTLVTAPEQEPLTLEEAKAQLRLDGDEDDALVRRLIMAARMWVEGQTKKALMPQTWDQVIDWCWPYKYNMPWIQFEKNPATSVTSITYQSGASPQPTLNATQYTVVSREHSSYIAPAYGISWPTPLSVPEAVTIRFIAGYTDVPEPLKHAVAMLVAHWYENREATVMAVDVSNVPLTIQSLLASFKTYYGGS